MPVVINVHYEVSKMDNNASETLLGSSSSDKSQSPELVPHNTSVFVRLHRRLLELYTSARYRLSDFVFALYKKIHPCICGRALAKIENELRLAGFYDKDTDYGPGVIGDAVLKLAAVHYSEQHSGFSHELASHLFKILVGDGGVLSPITDNPEDWTDVSGFCGNSESITAPAYFANTVTGEKLIFKEGDIFQYTYNMSASWQNRRDTRCFSHDGGKTYWTLADRDQTNEGGGKLLVLYHAKHHVDAT